MWTRSTAPPTSPTAFRSSAFQWASNTGRRAPRPDGGRNSGSRGDLRSHARRTLRRRTRARSQAERQADPVSRIAALAEALVATGFPSRKRHETPNIHFYHEFSLRSHGVRRAGSAALDLAYVAAAGSTLFGSSTSIPGTRQPEFSWSRKPAAASQILPARISGSPATKFWPPTA